MTNATLVLNYLAPVSLFYVEETLKLRLDVVLQAKSLLNLLTDAIEKLLFNFEFVFQNMLVTLP